MAYAPLSGPPEENMPTTIEPGNSEIKTWHRSTIAAVPSFGNPHPPVDRFRARHKRPVKEIPQQLTTSDIPVQPPMKSSSVRKASKLTDSRSELPLLLRQSRAAARHRELARSDILTDDDNQEIEPPAPDANKQTWKRGGELPELAMAHIRDRVGYKRRASHNKRLSIILGRAPPIVDFQTNHNLLTVSSAVDAEGENPETMLPVKEEDDDDSDTMSAYEDSQGSDSDNQDNLDAGPDNVHDLQRADGTDPNESEGLSDEIRRLQLESHARKFISRRSLLNQLQNEEDAAVSRQSRKGPGQQEHKRKSRRQSQVTRRSTLVNNVVISDNIYEPSYDYVSADEEAEARLRRRLRVKTRDAKVDLFAEPSDEDSDEDESEEEEDVKVHLGMTQQERDAAFQKLLTQYLGLLQCTPAEVARRLQVN
ncbi:hypothetical protein P3T76_007067 [Phytophthora citrophthora]|uniref:Uncharacterized protein n=1 Tax=Phytophthora citrophthora TaxID=4793 RepID=A0AAD9GMK7_9STRA|nr:hypothetical protein P3T76_007067 [Phytophthora citrophthora]